MGAGGCPEQGWLAGQTLTGFKVKKTDHTWDQAARRRRRQSRGVARVCRTTLRLLTSDRDKPVGSLLTGEAGNQGQEELGGFVFP